MSQYYIQAHRGDILGVTRNIDLTTTADNNLYLNTHGKSWISGGTGASTAGAITNLSSLSSGTVTNFGGYTGTGRTGTNVITNNNLTSSAKWATTKLAVSGNILRTETLLYLSCSASTASANAKCDFQFYGTVIK